MSDIYRYEFDENGVCYRKPDGPFVSHDDYAALHYDRIHHNPEWAYEKGLLLPR